MSAYRYIKIDGPVSVSQWDAVLTPQQNAMVILILGTSGAGKSHFISSLGGCAPQTTPNWPWKEENDGNTVSVNAFSVNMAAYVDHTQDDDSPWNIYIIDTPGLSGRDISTVEMIENLREWIESHGVGVIFRVAYFCSILGTGGISSEERRAVETFKSMAGVKWAASIVVITTNWDLVVRSKIERLRAEQRFVWLREDVWQDVIEGEGRIVKFLNTQISALEVLDQILGARAGSYYHIEQMIDKGLKIRDTPFAPHVYGDLLDRIFSLRCQLRLQENIRRQLDIDLNAHDAGALDERSENITRRLSTLQRHLDDFGGCYPE